MQLKILCAVVAFVVGLSLQAGFSEANAQSANSGKTNLKGDALFDALSPGLQKKFEPKAGGGYEFTGKGRLNDKFASVLSSLNPSTDTNTNTDGEVDGSGNVVTVCPTSLTDEEMRLCLGLPAVKKAVRVKRLNVQIGQAE